ncbi:hypothetical protein BKA70DRAFT_876985 [Coprinopsis sp. MPI-PUGE-AT-0042]|nr:hypothetical protein BKA70DRAFT_876985 [Coprinopsis sp. MPI-PUGE-AT-0042]
MAPFLNIQSMVRLPSLLLPSSFSFHHTHAYPTTIPSLRLCIATSFSLHCIDFLRRGSDPTKGEEEPSKDRECSTRWHFDRLCKVHQLTKIPLINQLKGFGRTSNSDRLPSSMTIRRFGLRRV